jgi:hypothetical protein
MPNTHLPEPQRQPEHIAREAVLSGQRIPVAVQAQLEARGIDVGALEQRLIAQQQWRH